LKDSRAELISLVSSIQQESVVMFLK